MKSMIEKKLGAGFAVLLVLVALYSALRPY